MSKAAAASPSPNGDTIVFGSFEATPIVTSVAPKPITPPSSSSSSISPAPAAAAAAASPSAWGAASRPPPTVLSAAGLPPSLQPKQSPPPSSSPSSSSSAAAAASPSANSTGPRPPLSDIKREQVSLSTRLHPFLTRGFVNNGNLCFMNAVLQALIASRPFYALCTYLSNHEIPSRCVFLAAFARLISEFPEGQPVIENRPLYAEFLTKLIDERFAKMGSRETQIRRQEDAQELLTFLLNSMHEELLTLRGKGKKEKQSKEEWNEVGRKQKVATLLESTHAESFISWIFDIHVKSTVRRDGGKASARVEPMTTLPLEVEYGTVEAALEAFFAPETLEGVKEGASLVQARKHMQLHVAPPILILHIKRFGFETSSGTQKIVDFFHYPLECSLPQEGAKGRLLRNYTLLAVIAHHGQQSGRGHYTADVRQASGRWLSFDDGLVRGVSLEEVLRRQAYLLFYALRE